MTLALGLVYRNVPFFFFLGLCLSTSIQPVTSKFISFFTIITGKYMRSMGSVYISYLLYVLCCSEYALHLEENAPKGCCGPFSCRTFSPVFEFVSEPHTVTVLKIQEMKQILKTEIKVLMWFLK